MYLTNLYSDVLISDNTVLNCAAAVYLHAPAGAGYFERTVISGNRLGDDRSSGQTSAYGIYISAAGPPDGMMIESNDVTNNTSAGIYVGASLARTHIRN